MLCRCIFKTALRISGARGKTKLRAPKSVQQVHVLPKYRYQIWIEIFLEETPGSNLNWYNLVSRGPFRRPHFGRCPDLNSIWCQFHEHFKYAFYTLILSTNFTWAFYMQIMCWYFGSKNYKAETYLEQAV